MRSAVPQILTVDVEDWFHILDASGGPTPDDWPRLESRVEANTDRLLELFAQCDATATFFVVGWVAERHPALLRRISEAGHELGSHSYWHQTIRHYDARELREDLERSRKAIEDASATRITGFRAPGNSITRETAWALEVIREAGFAYDSSLCPGVSSHGGFENGCPGPHRIRVAAGDLVEIPSSTWKIGGRRIPYAGGGYLRLLPYPLIRAGVDAEARRGRPTNVYLHPREIDPGQPRLRLSPLRSFKYYVGLAGTEKKVRSLLRDYRWVSAAQWIEANPTPEPLLDLRGADA